MFNRYPELVRTLADRALTLSDGALPVTASSEPLVSIGSPAARLLLRGAPDQYPGLVHGLEVLARVGTAAPGHPARFNDTLGFSRPVYHPLLLHLHLKALERRRDVMPDAVRATCDNLLAQAVAPAMKAHLWADVDPPSEHMHLALWWALCLHEAAQAGSDNAHRMGATGGLPASVNVVEVGKRRDTAPTWEADLQIARLITQRVLDHPGPEGALHPRSDDDLLDAWTFREITALHALAQLAARENNADWRSRVERAARHHQAYTQPDYTTYQPWAVAAFLACPETVLFADQQLHDTTTNLHLERPGAVVAAGLLLADAV